MDFTTWEYICNFFTKENFRDNGLANNTKQVISFPFIIVIMFVAEVVYKIKDR